MARWLFRAVFATILLCCAGGAVVLRFGDGETRFAEASSTWTPEHPLTPRWRNEPRPGLEFGPSVEPDPTTLSPAGRERVLRRLARRLATAPGDATARSNLAALLIAGADDDEERAVDLLTAYRETEGVLTTAPQRPEARFNRALTLDRLGLREPASAAWRAVLDTADPEDQATARRRLAELDAPRLFDLWETEGRDRLLAAAREDSPEAVIHWTREYRPFVRQWVEEVVVPCWAGAELDTCPAGIGRGAPNVAERLGEALATVIRDRTLADSLTRMSTDAPTRAQVLRGLRRYGRGMALHRSYGDAAEKEWWLARAERDLREAGAPLWRYARLYRAGAWGRDRPAHAQRQLALLAADSSATLQPALVARIHWSMGTNEVVRNRFEQALPHYETTRELLLASDGPGVAAFADLLSAEALSRLGETDAAWAHRTRALRGLAAEDRPKDRHPTLYSSVEQLFLEGRAEVAKPFVEELRANAERWGTTIGFAEAALQTGRLQATRGDFPAARASFEQAWLDTARIEDDALRRRTEATLTVYQAEALIEGGEPVPEPRLDAARAAMIELDYRYSLPRLDAVRAEVALRRGDRVSAIARLDQAIAEEERIRHEVADLTLRAFAFEGAQRAFDLRIGLTLDAGDESEAFRWAEASRARVLGDLLTARYGGPSEPPSPEDVAAALPDDTDLLELAVLPDRLVGWHLSRSGVRMRSLPIGRADLTARVERFREAIEHGAEAERVREIGGELHDLLLAPFLGGIARDRHLVVVPDRALARIPFAALWDDDTESYLIERYPITLAPSAGAYLALRARAARHRTGAPMSVLAVGAQNPGMPPLPQVAAEARGVADLYPHGIVLTGADATRERFLEAAPDVDVLHFAGHGEDHRHALTRSRLWFAPTKGWETGLLYGGDLVERRFETPRVAVLAACRTAAWGERGREPISGLAAAFLAAGVPSVVASLWQIDDTAAQELMTHLHRNLRRGMGPSEALQRAQTEIIWAASRLDPPQDWAGFVTVGFR